MIKRYVCLACPCPLLLRQTGHSLVSFEEMKRLIGLELSDVWKKCISVTTFNSWSDCWLCALKKMKRAFGRVA